MQGDERGRDMLRRLESTLSEEQIGRAGEIAQDIGQPQEPVIAAVFGR